ncbi:MAG: biotin transporter BioY [Caldisericia bacterium]
MRVKRLILSSLFTCLIIIGAYISIPLPLTPIPFTLQLLFVLLSGVFLGPFYGSLSSIIYILIGVLGFPVFSGGNSGVGYLFGKTGGYLFGFIIASFVTGYIYKIDKKLLPVAIISGIFLIHLCGILYLSQILSLNIYKAFIIGSLPFIPVDLVKGILVYIISLSLLKNREIRRIFLIKES